MPKYEKFLSQIIFVNRTERTPTFGVKKRWEMEFWAGHYQAWDVDSRPALTLTFVLFFFSPLAAYFHHFPSFSLFISFSLSTRHYILFPRKWICFSRIERLLPPLSEWDDQILLCRRWPVQTMTSWKVFLHGKQDEKYLAWFFVRLLSSHKLIERAIGIMSRTCMQLVGEIMRHHEEFLSKDSWKLRYTDCINNRWK